MASQTESQQDITAEQTAESDSQAPSAASPRTDVPATAGASVAEGPVTAAAAAGGAAPPRATVAAPTPIHHLNNTTAKLSQWDVEIANAHEEEFEYKWEGKTRTAKVCKRHLVYAHGPKTILRGRNPQG